MKSKCPIFKATGKRTTKTECQVCPFNAKCPEDKLNDVIAEILRDIGEYLYEKRQGAS